MIVDVRCEDGTTQIAKTLLESEDSYRVQFLERNKYNLYEFVDECEDVPREAVSGFYDVENLEDTHLFARHPQGYELIDDSEDEDFECSDEESSESDDVSLVDEDEDEDEA